MDQRFTYKNNFKNRIRVILEPLAYDFILEAGSTADISVEVADSSLKFEVEEKLESNEITIFLPARFGRCFLSIDRAVADEI